MIRRPLLNMRDWQTWFWIGVIAAAGYLAYLLVSGLLTPAPTSAPSDDEMQMHDIISRGQHGKSGWRFTADSSVISPDGYTTTYRQVRDATFLRDGRPAYRLTAGTVTVDSRNENYSATDGVHIWSNSPTLPDDLQTSDAYWDQAGQTPTCPTATRFVYHGALMITTHMTVDLDTGASQLGDTSVDYFNTPGPVRASTGTASPVRT